jgi:hypothetical protein
VVKFVSMVSGSMVSVAVMMSVTVGLVIVSVMVVTMDSRSGIK